MNHLDTITFDSEDVLESLLARSVEEQWGDGLPLIPPTRARVEAALDAVHLPPDHLIGVIPPMNGRATVLSVTINAVMAGCTPQMLPLVFAATEALAVPSFNLLACQVTTHPVGPAAFVSGPLGASLGVNSDAGAFGPGNRVNATVGRALRLILLNLGGAVPKTVDLATFGNPGKYTWFFGENQEASPFESWAQRSGAAPGGSTVTVYGAGGYLNMLETTSSADELLRVFAHSMAAPNNNDLLLAGQPLLVLCPEHAEVLANGGYSLQDIQQQLWETARLEVKDFSDSAQRYRLQPNWTEQLGTLQPDTRIPLCRQPEHFHILVSGGAGRHSVYLQGAGATVPATVSVDKYVRAG